MQKFKMGHLNRYGMFSVKSALYPGSPSYNFLKYEFIPYIKTWVPITNNQNYCINGLIHQTVNALLLLSRNMYYNESTDKKFILTRKCITDPLENFFSTMKNHGGNNHLPSVHESSYIIGKMLSRNIRIFHENTKNCENDFNELLNENFVDQNGDMTSDINEIDENLENDSLVEKSLEILVPEFNPITETTDIDENEKETEDENVDEILIEMNSVFLEDSVQDFIQSTEKQIANYCKIINLKKEVPEDASLRYVVGFVLNKQFKTHVKCEECRLQLSTTDKLYNSKSELLLKYKGINFEKYTVYNPRDFFFYICKLQYQIYSECIKTIFHIKNVIKAICINETKKIFPNFYDEDDCLEHKYIRLDYLLKILLKRNCKWIVNEEIKNQKDLFIEKTVIEDY